MARQSEQYAGPGQFRPVAVPNTRTAPLFALEVVLCGRWGIRCTAERMVRDFQVHISSQPESVLAGARNCACLVVPNLDTPCRPRRISAQFVTKLLISPLFTGRALTLSGVLSGVPRNSDRMTSRESALGH
jgi:hypothetical protein